MILSLDGYTPAPRNPPDDAPWTQARIEEAQTHSGTWTIIEPAFGLSPPVTDPANPPTYNFTTDGAQLTAGWYRVVWIDEHATEQPSEPVELRPAPAWAPTIADVAGLVRVRTRDDLGKQQGTFTAGTQPTAADVQRLIANEAALVMVRVGDLDSLPCPTAEDVRGGARNLIAKRVAAIIEASYRPEEVAAAGGTLTMATFYQGSQKDDEAALVTAAEQCRDWQPGEVGPGYARASWYYPPAAPMRW